jgi:hypothetical protein
MATYDAWCGFSAYFSTYDRDTLAFGLAKKVCRLAWSEDKFQAGMFAILDELNHWKMDWKRNYPKGEGEEPLHPDDVHKYLFQVAYNAIKGGRKRRPVPVSQEQVASAADTENLPPLELLENEDVANALKRACTNQEDAKLVEMKSRRMREAEIGEELSLSRDQVQRRLSRIYKLTCQELGMKPTPMGRAKREADDEVCRDGGS